MGVEAVAAKMSRRVSPDAESVATYRQSLAWLFKHLDRTDLEALLSGRSMPLPAVFACDVYWVSHDQLRKDMLKTWKHVGGNII